MCVPLLLSRLIVCHTLYDGTPSSHGPIGNVAFACESARVRSRRYPEAAQPPSIAASMQNAQALFHTIRRHRPCVRVDPSGFLSIRGLVLAYRMTQPHPPPAPRQRLRLRCLQAPLAQARCRASIGAYQASCDWPPAARPSWPAQINRRHSCWATRLITRNKYRFASRA